MRVGHGWPEALRPQRWVLLLLALAVGVALESLTFERGVAAGANAAASPPAPAAAYLVHADGSGSLRLPDGVLQLVWAPADDRFVTVQRSEGTLTIALASADDPGDAVSLFTSADNGPVAVRWSPDGGSLAFSVGSRLQVAGADGSGQLHRIADHVYAFAWTPDSTKLSVVQWDGTAGHGESLTTVSAADGAMVDRIVPLQTAICPSALAWSPDGRLLAFGVDSGENPACGEPSRAAHGVWLWNQAAHALRQVEQQPADLLPRWTADGRIVAAREDDPFTREIVAYDASGGTQSLASYQDNCREPQDLGAGAQLDGGTVLYLDTSGDLPQVTLLPLVGDDPLDLSPSDRYTALPLLSPDGSAVAYSAPGDDGFAGLAIVAADGTPRAAIAGDGLSLRAASWSADGAWLFVTAADQPLSRCTRADQ